MALLEVSGLCLTLGQGNYACPLVADVSFNVGRGEVLALIGESGSGKSLTCRAVVNLLPPTVTMTSGDVAFDGVAIHGRGAQVKSVRGERIGMIFQDPISHLDPLQRVGEGLVECLALSDRAAEKRSVSQEAKQLLEEVRLTQVDQIFGSYPHELSGGQAQRVAIALALCRKPELLIADEPTSSLDATVQRDILVLMAQIVRSHGLAVLLTTHDHDVVRAFADRVAILNRGRVIGAGSVEDALSCYESSGVAIAVGAEESPC